MYLYNLTLQRATGITHSVHGNFSGAKLQVSFQEKQEMWT
jgi:splicing factor 3B subunit 3